MTADNAPETALVYEMRAEFGPYLRALRVSQGLTLQRAAAALSVSATWLQKLETSGRVARPARALVARLAALYSRPVSEVEAEAGIRLAPLGDPDAVEHERFATLMLDPRWRPPGMSRDWLDAYSLRQKRDVLELARRLTSSDAPSPATGSAAYFSAFLATVPPETPVLAFGDLIDQAGTGQGVLVCMTVEHDPRFDGPIVAVTGPHQGHDPGRAYVSSPDGADEVWDGGAPTTHASTPSELEP